MQLSASAASARTARTRRSRPDMLRSGYGRNPDGSLIEISFCEKQPEHGATPHDCAELSPVGF